MKCDWLLLVLCWSIRKSMASVVYPIYFVGEHCLPGNEKISYEIGAPSMPAVILNATRHPTYSPFRDCTIELVPHPQSSDGIIASVINLDLQSSSAGDCIDYIQMHSVYGTLSKKLCGFRTDFLGLLTYSTTGSLYLHYQTGMWTPAHTSQKGFVVIATAYSHTPCQNDEFRCNNQRCIWKGLTCDGFNNCGDRSDERHSLCYTLLPKPDFSEFYVILFSSCIAFAFIFLTGLIIWYLRRRTRAANASAQARELPPIDRPPAYSAQPQWSAFAMDKVERPPPYEP